MDNLESQIKYELLPDGSGYSVSATIDFNATTIKIPSTYNSLPVKEIETYGFHHLDSLREVELPNTIIRINDDGFHRCPNLEKINIPDSVEYLGDRAFYFCQKLKNFSLGKNVKTIGTNCFQRCESIGDIEFPKSVEMIGKKILLNSFSTKKVYFSSVPKVIDREAFTFKYLDKIYFKMDMNEFIKNAILYPKPLLPNTYALVNNKYTKVKEEELDKYLRDNCEKLYLNEPIVVRKQFANALFLKELVIGPNVRVIDNNAFYNCVNLSKITINPGLERIGDSAFQGSGIEEIELPETVRFIDDYAFSKMMNLKRISFPQKVEYYRNWLSKSNPNVQVKWPKYANRLIDAVVSNFSLYQFETMIIPEGITYVPSNLIQNNNHIKHIIFPKTVLEIKPYTLNNCTNLESITLGNEDTFVATNAFYGCNKLIFKDSDKYPLVKCKDGGIRVKKIYTYQKVEEIKELFKDDYSLDQYGGIFKKKPGEYNSVDELIESFFKYTRNKVVLCSDATLMPFFSTGNKESISIHDSDKNLCFTKMNKGNFKDDRCVAMFYKRDHCDLAIVKVSKMSSKDLWTGYYYHNEDFRISCYITDDKGETYWLIHNWYDY